LRQALRLKSQSSEITGLLRAANSRRHLPPIDARFGSSPDFPAVMLSLFRRPPQRRKGRPFLGLVPAETRKLGSADGRQFGEPGFEGLPNNLALADEIFVGKDITHAEDLPPRYMRVARFRIIVGIPGRPPMARRRYAVASWAPGSCGNASRVSPPVSVRSARSIRECPTSCRSTVHLPSEYLNRSGLNPGAPARVDGLASHEVYPGSKNFLHYCTGGKDHLALHRTCRASPFCR